MLFFYFNLIQEFTMIKVGDALPAATLMEYSEVEGNGCLSLIHI